MAKKFEPKESDRDSKTTGGRTGRRPNRRGKKGSPKEFDRKEKSGYRTTSNDPCSSINDISWYSRNPELLLSAAMIPFPNKPGMDLKMGDIITPEAWGLDPVQAFMQMPGVMRLDYSYTFGVSRDVNSPASITAKELFGRIRAKFSGSLDEDAPDLFMYCMALDQIHAYIAWMKRLYRTINTHSSQNYMMPERFFEAQFPASTTAELLGVKYAHPSFQANKVLLWQYINTLVNMVNKFAVPMNMDIYTRHRWMNENVYMDNNAMMAQAYVFTPRGFYQIDDTSETGSRLVFKPLGQIFDTATHRPSVSNIYLYGRELIEALSNWEDAYTINGHIQRAFEDTPFYISEILAQDEMLLPVYVEEVLTQIHNVNVVEMTNPDIRQEPNTNAIIFEPEWEGDIDRFKIIDVDSLVPTPAEVTIATRLTAIPDADSAELYCGTEVVNSIWLTHKDVPNPEANVPQWINVTSWMFNDQEFEERRVEMVSLMRAYCELAAWRKAPLIFAKYVTTANGVPIPWMGNSDLTAWLVGSITNPTVVSAEQMADLHRVCVYSEFNCFNKGSAK